MDEELLIVSKCLIGGCCRYDGKCKPDPELCALAASGRVIAVCPEQLGGLPTPRVSAELTGSGELVLEGKARAVTRDGRDVTDAFLAGACSALRTAEEAGAKRAVLKAKSPSCGMGLIYDGSFSGRLVRGNGVTAALFIKNGIEVETR